MGAWVSAPARRRCRITGLGAHLAPKYAASRVRQRMRTAASRLLRFFQVVCWSSSASARPQDHPHRWSFRLWGRAPGPQIGLRARAARPEVKRLEALSAPGGTQEIDNEVVDKSV